MAGTAIRALQQAIKSRLEADTGAGGLMTIATGVFDGIPASPTYPYVTLGEWTERRLDAFGQLGHDATLSVQLWSRTAGYDEAFRMLDRVIVVLDNASFTVTGFTLVACQVEESQSFRDADGITYRVTAKVRNRVEG